MWEKLLSRSARRDAMPLFIVERNFAEQVELNRDIVTESIPVNTDVDIKWLSSFLIHTAGDLASFL
jgi:hypothetical protein